MTKSLLNKIPHSFHCSYITNKWMNGKVGEIVDIIGDGSYRFVDYVIEGDVIRKFHISKEEELSCPVIASGIVGYWLHNRDKFTIKPLFESYFSMKMSQYEKEHENDNDAWNRDLEKEFALHYHIPTEKKAIHSSEAIFEFLTEEDAQKIRNITKNCLKFIRFKLRLLYPPQYASNRVIEDTFFSAYDNGGGAYECMDWFRIEYDLPYMGNHWGSGKNKKSQLCGRMKVWHEVDAPAFIQEEFEDFDERVLMYSNGGMMDEINENLKICQTREDRIRYIISLLQPFKSFADAFYPKTRINERKKTIEQDKKWRADYETMPEDTKDQRTGEPIHPQRQIEAIDKSIERYQKDIEYWEGVQDRFYWFAQHGLTGEFTKEENSDMCTYLGHWWSLMITFSRRLAALALTYGIKLMDIQEECGIYLNWHFMISDYVDEKFILSPKHARKLLDEIESKNTNIEVNKRGNTDKEVQEDNVQVFMEHHNIVSTPIYISYNWQSGEEIVKQLCSALDKATIKYAIDKEDCLYRKSIREFENQLGSADMIISVITDEYLKSCQCMRELALISKKGMIDIRLFPIVNLANRDVTVFAQYRQYWFDELKKYDTIDNSPGNDGPVLEVKQDINLIINEFSNIWDYIKHMNTPSWEILSQNDCKLIIDEILERINQRKYNMNENAIESTLLSKRNLNLQK